MVQVLLKKGNQVKVNSHLISPSERLIQFVWKMHIIRSPFLSKYNLLCVLILLVSLSPFSLSVFSVLKLWCPVLSCPGCPQSEGVWDLSFRHPLLPGRRKSLWALSYSRVWRHFSFSLCHSLITTGKPIPASSLSLSFCTSASFLFLVLVLHALSFLPLVG